VIVRLRPDGSAGADSEALDGLRINIRLLPGVHGALFGELVGVSRGFRSARAIQLMTVGLMHERGRTGRPPTSEGSPDAPTKSPDFPAGPTSGDEDRVFVRAVLDSSGEEL
jgi:hypothetical protein